MIARLERTHRFTDGFNDPNTFMPEHAAGGTGRNVAVENVQICAADRSMCDTTIASPGWEMAGLGCSSRLFCPGP
jgi:hypothetical protein